ncbi:MAG: Eco57I restriction-modification methylase domain-containing protein [Acidobacteriota bacterium]|nr:Eco57I restriction-modification methylase domain-containing protein [Acidobacteriota bacterium]
MMRTAVRDALAQGAGLPFDEAAFRLLDCLGFRSDRTLPGQTGRVADLPEAFTVNQRATKTARDFKAEATSARVLFQLGDDEIRHASQSSLLEGAGRFDAGSTKSFLFVAVELRGSAYSRTRYSQFAREMNQGLAMPAFVLFRERGGGRMALAFVDRRPHKRDGKREVLSGVSLIRDVEPSAPHRAHVDILADLSLNQRLAWMGSRGKSRNFDGLRAAVLDALDTEELNKRFYKELFTWFERALEEAKFPADPNRTVDPEHHVIRLITRLMFIWFIKEKGLVAEELFVQEKLNAVLKDYDAKGGHSWYRAVLQNLFFATLNTEIDRRGFSSRKRRTHRVPSHFRYQDLMADSARLVSLFGETPFINGGLFECLDSDLSQTRGGYRIDCFTDNTDHRKKILLPDGLFFDDDGLIPLFDRYRFTVEENTQVEKEVALDPELLGSVFENLLAAVNPETKETARKQSGSFYTPRPVVDYMVDEALALTLANAVAPDDGDLAWWRERLLYLLDPAAAFDESDEELFTPAEREGIVHAVADLTVLDPAVGSGAFLISVLNVLTQVLRRLDPHNEFWEAEQRRRAGERARDTYLQADDDRTRKERLTEIDEIFTKYRDSDFGRKLYLIQNGLHGVDVQPVACLITKLRFFISLAIEQDTSQDPARNFGIRPLPNLETRILAANTLIGVPGQATIRTPDQEQIEASLHANRERHFHAATRREKLLCRERDYEIRQALEVELLTRGLPSPAAKRVASWNPYDQNACADWFDPAYMFGVAEGFDIVIGNPPYVESRNGALFPSTLKSSYRSQSAHDWDVDVPKGSDLLIYFFWRAAHLLADRGSAVFITQNAWLSTNYGRKFQQSFLTRGRFEKIVDSERKFFPDAGAQNINTVVSIFSRKTAGAHVSYQMLDAAMNDVVREASIETASPMKWGHQLAMSDCLREALRRLSETSAMRRPPVGTIKFGQGLNFPMARATGAAGGVPVVMKRVQFANLDYETTAEVAVSPRRQVPALFMPRGIGSRFYCTMNFGRAYTYSHVELYLPVDWWEGELHYCLWAFMNSSLAWLFRETTGRTNLGGGMLKAEATDMKSLPIGLFGFGDEARRVLDTHKDRPPLPVDAELASEEHLYLDRVVLAHLVWRTSEKPLEGNSWRRCLQGSTERRDEPSQRVDLTPDGVKYHLDHLRVAGAIRRVGSTKAGRWEVL